MNAWTASRSRRAEEARRGFSAGFPFGVQFFTPFPSRKYDIHSQPVLNGPVAMLPASSSFRRQRSPPHNHLPRDRHIHFFNSIPTIESEQPFYPRSVYGIPQTNIPGLSKEEQFIGGGTQYPIEIPIPHVEFRRTQEIATRGSRPSTAPVRRVPRNKLSLTKGRRPELW